jgi:hypothetical protein
VHERALRPAVHPGIRRPPELGEHPVGAVDQPQPGHRPRQRGHLVGDAGVLEHPEHLVVEVHRPREAVRRAVPFEHQHLESVPGEEQRRRQPDRPGADHDDGLGGHRPSVLERGAGPPPGRANGG